MLNKKDFHKQNLKDLMKEKDELEKFVKEKQSELLNYKGKGFESDLIDEEGFP